MKVFASKGNSRLDLSLSLHILLQCMLRISNILHMLVVLTFNEKAEQWRLDSHQTSALDIV